MTTNRHAVVCSPGFCGGKLWGKPTHDRQSSQVYQEMQGRFPAPDTGLGTHSPISFSCPQPPLRMRGRGGNHMVFLHSKYLHLALIAPLLNFSTGGFYILSFSLQIRPIGSVSWSLLWTHFAQNFCLFHRHFLSFLLCVCLCGSQMGRLEAAVLVWPDYWFTDVQSIMT